VVIYASGTPEDEYRLLWKATLNSSSEHELARFVIPEEGMWAGGFNILRGTPNPGHIFSSKKK